MSGFSNIVYDIQLLRIDSYSVLNEKLFQFDIFNLLFSIITYTFTLSTSIKYIH